MNARAVGDVFKDRFGEGIGFLKYHADTGAELHHVHFRRVDVLAVKRDIPFDLRPGDRVVHAIERAEEGRFAAAGRANQRGDIVLPEGERNVGNGLFRAIPHVDVLRGDFRLIGNAHQRVSNLLRR